MNRALAEQIATLLNEQNQLTVKYDADRVMQEAVECMYICRVDDDEKLLGVACVKRVQWYQCEIRHLSVKVKRRGVGSWLLAQAYERAKTWNTRVMQCTIRVGNAESEGFFIANAFAPTATFLNADSGNRVTVYQKVLAPAAIDEKRPSQFPLTAVPIFLPNSHGAFDFFGTGTFVLYRERFFLVTAAHVFDGEEHSRELMVGVSPNAHMLARLPSKGIVSPMPQQNSRKHDPIDMAIMPISVELAAGLSSTGAAFVILDDRNFEQFTVQPGDDIIFAGFPASLQRLFPLPEGMHVMPPVANALYLHQVPAEESAAVGYDTKRHLIGRFLHPDTRPPGFDAKNLRYESYNGMSGGAIWHRNAERTLFAGIITAWRPPDDKGYLMGTRLSETRKMFDDARALSIGPCDS